MNRSQLLAAAAAVAVAAVVAGLAVWWGRGLQNWLAVHTGTVNESGGYYGFWSGFGSDIGEVAIVGGLISIYRRHNCEVHGCWRLGRHMTAAMHKVCRVHHPEDHLTAAAVLERHALAADGPVSGGAGDNPAGAGLPADGPVVPPPAAPKPEGM